MSRTRIKICGVMRPEDAAYAAEAGADAIGMIFYPTAARRISNDRARQIISVLPPFVTPVGVFVNAGAQDILDTAAEVGLRTVQLNGNETPDDVAALEGVRVSKAIHVSRATLGDALDKWKSYPPNLIGIVLEPAGTGQPGGSGVANDWDAIRQGIESGMFRNLPPIIAAGGLKPQTVGDVVRILNPYAVDVSSGVESEPGVKSREKIDAFIRAVRASSPLA